MVKMCCSSSRSSSGISIGIGSSSSISSIIGNKPKHVLKTFKYKSTNVEHILNM